MDNQNQVPQNQAPQTPPVQEKNTNAVIALVTGIVGLVFAFCGLWLNIVGIVCAIVAIIFAVKGRKVAAKKGMATAGLVTGIIAVVLCPIFLGCNICARCVVGSANEIKNIIEDEDWQSELEDALKNYED